METIEGKQPGLRPFIPAVRSSWLLPFAQQFIRTDLFLNNKIHIRDEALQLLQQLPGNAGVMLASNHADETDPRVCIEFSRRSRKSFLTMCNREAFDELLGLSGYVLRRLGYFSIERGRHDAPAVSYAIDVVKQGRDVLVIFPEGEIYYLNEEVQPFHSGAVEIGMRAVIANRQTDPNWSAYIVPMALKYHYIEPLDAILDKRISDMEKRLMLRTGDSSIAERLLAIQSTLLQRHETTHQVVADETMLTQKIQSIEQEMLMQVEQKHADLIVSQKHTIDKSFQLRSELEDSEQHLNADKKAEVKKDIEELREVEELCSWRPHYYLETNSQDRFAEVVLKLERELYKIARPRQLGRREVLVDIATPIDLGAAASRYMEEPSSVRHELTTQLHGQIQTLISNLTQQSNAGSSK